MSMPRLRSPIVLAHGLLGFATFELGGRTVASYFHRVPALLRDAGNTVVQPAVPPTGSIASRARALGDAIRDTVGSEPVHIIAHSMGGLDARFMITHLGMAAHVLSLTTLGTPHRGTELADRGVRFAERFRLLSGLRVLGIPDEAFHDLGRESCETFNRMTPDAPNVRYASVAGDKPRSELLWAMRFSYDVIAEREGPNDGLVSVRSAAWGESFEVWPCDHVNLVGWVGPRERLLGYGHDVTPGYRGILERLATM